MTVIADITIPSEDFVLGETMRAVPADRIEIEQLVPSSGLALPYFWIEATDADTAEAALGEEPVVEAVTQVDAFDDRVLFRIEWTEDVDSFLANLVAYEVAVLEAVGTDDEWQFQLRFPEYDSLSAFYRAGIEDGVDMELDRVHNPVEAASRSRFGLTTDQKETLTAAYDGGYFSIPRGTTISELGETLGVSDSAVSQRLRRGESSLITATLLTAADTSLSGHRE
ncbi:helix-turn-helix domain-containing protein [Halococcus agarilyticus]|uniref:helix-turn-helix domain-containing protein n=1 Tax=Halococcus agarilyticus TaxID=1232219 RepID=UPI00067809A8|nr:helix-turn-helix domain-containing protein [Halococcus agarilyticus]